MGTNHFGHAALVARLFPKLSRVVVISSIAARGGSLGPDMTLEELTSPPAYAPQKVYSNTKQANLLFAQELHRRVGDRVPTTAAHPGVSWTNLFVRQLKDEGRGWLVPPMRVLGPVFLQSARAGAAPTLMALDAPSGSFVGPKGLNQSRGKPHLLEVYRNAADPATAARLWQLTEEVLGIPLPS
jgi:NAD(P)-dependent dehydrogenase (short-subunit alcohol dehydrogenase family)